MVAISGWPCLRLTAAPPSPRPRRPCPRRSHRRLPTTILSTSARNNGVSIDTLTWEFPIHTVEEKDVASRPNEEAYIKGLLLEGAGWSYDNSCLCEPEPMELIYQMPMIHFKPIEAKKSKAKGVYQCPDCLYPLTC